MLKFNCFPSHFYLYMCVLGRVSLMSLCFKDIYCSETTNSPPGQKEWRILIATWTETLLFTLIFLILLDLLKMTCYFTLTSALSCSSKSIYSRAEPFTVHEEVNTFQKEDVRYCISTNCFKRVFFNTVNSLLLALFCFPPSS